MKPYKVDFEESELQTIETAREYPITHPTSKICLKGIQWACRKSREVDAYEYHGGNVTHP